MPERKRRDEAERFWEKVGRCGADECWPWKAGTHKGYAIFRPTGENSKGRKEHASVTAWRLTNGPIPKGLEIDHLCTNRLCANPGHMEPVTHAENMRRMWRRGTRTGRKNTDGSVTVYSHGPREPSP